MNGHFTTEIGRMRCEEAVARGRRYQETKLLQRAEKVDRPVVRRVAHRRILLTAALSSLFMALMSTAAFAYPLSPERGVGPALGGGAPEVTTQPHVAATSTDPYLWILLAAVASAAILAVAVANVRKPVHS